MLGGGPDVGVKVHCELLWQGEAKQCVRCAKATRVPIRTQSVREMASSKIGGVILKGTPHWKDDSGLKSV